MRCQNAFPSFMLLVMSAQSAVEVRRGGWLNRVVEYHKKNFFHDIQEIAPIKINVSIVRTPEGYTDSNLWNFDSVVHLLVLIKQSDSSGPVRRALKWLMQPTRRFMMSPKDSYKHFPSLGKGSLNEIYYDFESEKEEDVVDEYGYADDKDEPQLVKDSGVIVVSNPVEAKLPSSSISIELLKNILLSRAIAARKMPTTTAGTLPWNSNTTDQELYYEDDESASTAPDEATETDNNEGTKEDTNQDDTTSDDTATESAADGAEETNDVTGENTDDTSATDPTAESPATDEPPPPEK